ncbi:hypothetical protein DC20_06760 [Rufibacter tibetensis]|uniref:DUF4142 domain-containing protein n=2 Tax=Rufibacter tibetensis TaxID=512763 RepID=A0A0P0D2E9_9BACT|nr:hypothetical protein DC20_06760 [Rufibacter tibetensis]
MGVAEVNNNATFDNPATGAKSDSMTANQNLDHLFMMNAASSGMMEVAAGKLAVTKGKNAGVKKYGQMMVTDHTKSNTELQALAKAKGVTLPTTLMPVHQQHLDMLSKLADLEFDKTYMQHMVEAHEMDIKLFDQEAKTGKDAEIKAFAAKNLPILQAHRKAAQPIFEEVGRDRPQAISR